MISASTKSALKVIVWNVNSIRKREIEVRDLLRDHNPDVVCFLETKCSDANFMHPDGYYLVENVAVAGRSGVTLLSRHPIDQQALDHAPIIDYQGRIIDVVICGINFVFLYVPNSSQQLKALDKRIAWNS